jgi:hypothetical protein
MDESTPFRLTKEGIKELTFGISSLDQRQREAVRQMLVRLHDANSGLVYPRDLHLALMKMQQAYVISEIDRHNVEAAILGS